MQNKVKIIYSFLKVISIIVFVSSLYIYYEEKLIIEKNKTFPCKILKKYCWHGKSGSSSLLVTYRGIKYFISIDNDKCDDIKKKIIDLYYNERFDYFFLKGHLNSKMVCFFGFFVIIVFSFKYFPDGPERP